MTCKWCNPTKAQCPHCGTYYELKLFLFKASRSWDEEESCVVIAKTKEKALVIANDATLRPTIYFAEKFDNPYTLDDCEEIDLTKAALIHTHFVHG